MPMMIPSNSVVQKGNILQQLYQGVEHPAFQSFWMGGYEGSDHINGAGYPIDINADNGHAALAYSDYLKLKEFNISTVRESIGWRLVEVNGVFDFSILDARITASNILGIQIIWTFCHYGWPNDIDAYSDSFVDRFVRFSLNAVEYIHAKTIKSGHIFSLFNEISFACWTADSNIHACPQSARDGGKSLKIQMVKATLQAISEIRKMHPEAKFLQCEPLIFVGYPPGWPGLEEAARVHNESQYEVMDMLLGIVNPELGGSPGCIDILGVNYYHNNQWGTGAEFHWHLQDSRRMPLGSLLLQCYKRYSIPLVISETSHVGSGRGAWILEVTEQVIDAIKKGLIIKGICLYPILDRPDWDNPEHWHHSGLWDVYPETCTHYLLERQLVEDYAASLKHSQTLYSLSLDAS